MRAVVCVTTVLAALGFAHAACAADAPSPDVAPSATPTAPVDPIFAYFADWQNRVEAAQASQPHWMTPMTTVTPRLEQEYRFDLSQQYLETGAQIDNYGGGKGLEVIPTTANEVLINVPNYEHRANVKPATGFADGNFVTIKQRLVSANEENGNYILSAFLGFQAPTGITAFTNRPA
jgi:hypothetical protein